VKEQWGKLFQIFWIFFKISPVSFGGGFAMIPLIEKEIVEKRKWVTKEDMTEILALSQTVPGAVAVNSATFIGHRITGIKGAVAAMAGVSLPTFLIVLVLGISYFYIQDNLKLEAAFVSIRVTIVALILYAAIKIAGTAIVDKTTFFIVIAGVPVLFLIHPIIAILLSGLTGIVVIFIKRKRGSNFDLKQHKQENSTMIPENYKWGAGI
jgi:chromate transporter